MIYFDTHCHLNHDLFQEDLEVVIKRAKDTGVTSILIPGWDVVSSKVAISLSEKISGVYAAVGIHPTEWQKMESGAIEEIRVLATHPLVVAIGEIGLDFHHDPSHPKEQSELLIKMLSIANSVNKPVLLHSRESMSALMGCLTSKEVKNNRGIIHSFEGNLNQANELIDLGYLLGVGGPITYKNSQLKNQVFSEISELHIVLETDAPYLPPVPNRGKRNEPSYLPLVGDYLSVLRNQNKNQLFDQIYQNSYKMFLQDINH